MSIVTSAGNDCSMLADLNGYTCKITNFFQLHAGGLAWNNSVGVALKVHVKKLKVKILFKKLCQFILLKNQHQPNES